MAPSRLPFFVFFVSFVSLPRPLGWSSIGGDVCLCICLCVVIPHAFWNRVEWRLLVEDRIPKSVELTRYDILILSLCLRHPLDWWWWQQQQGRQRQQQRQPQIWPQRPPKRQPKIQPIKIYIHIYLFWYPCYYDERCRFSLKFQFKDEQFKLYLFLFASLVSSSPSFAPPASLVGLPQPTFFCLPPSWVWWPH